MKQTDRIKIAIAGIGGIGGYLGGKLAAFYAGNPAVEIIFICRGEQLAVISEQGLALTTGSTVLSCRPYLVADNPSSIGKLDVLVLCTKTYSMQELLLRYRDCIKPDTVIITTQNAVNGKEIISPFLPDHTTVLEGCMYISANITAPGKIHHVSDFAKLYFGTNGAESPQGRILEEIFLKAGIDTSFSMDINPVLLKKFIFVSPAAVVTALYKTTYRRIPEESKYKEHYICMVEDLVTLARAKMVAVDEHTIENNCRLLGSFGPTVKSSFQLDLEKNKQSETDSLVRYVITESEKHGLPADHYRRALEQLTAMYNTGQ
jgi:2-dehydropantoate 2-reductase